MSPLQNRTPHTPSPPPGSSLTLSVGAPTSALRAGAACGACVAVLLVALAALAALQYTVPLNYAAPVWGHNPPAAREWREHVLPHPLGAWDARTYVPAFRGLLVLAWAAYTLAVASALRRGALPFRTTRVLVMGAAFAFAVFAPPVLATDSFAYVAYARLYALYGQNPYTCLPSYLVFAHDPTVPFLFWNLPTVYGPVWTLLSATLVAVLHGSGLWAQVVAMKVVEAVALVAAALAGRRVAEGFAPGRGDLAFLAIGLNPLLLLEGPGNGHNDLLLMAGLLGAAALQQRGRWGPAALVLGLSVGVKFITVLALPWLVLACVRDRHGGDRARAALGLALVALLPTVICYLPFWQGAATFAGLQVRSQFGQTPDALARDAQASGWLLGHGLPHGAILVALGRQWPVMLTLAVLTCWLWRRPGTPWLAAWPLLAAALMVWGLGMPSPWYLTWLWAAALTRWNRWGLAVSGVTLAASLAEEWFYGQWRAL